MAEKWTQHEGFWTNWSIFFPVVLQVHSCIIKTLENSSRRSSSELAIVLSLTTHALLTWNARGVHARVSWISSGASSLHKLKDKPQKLQLSGKTYRIPFPRTKGYLEALTHVRFQNISRSFRIRGVLQGKPSFNLLCCATTISSRRHVKTEYWLIHQWFIA